MSEGQCSICGKRAIGWDTPWWWDAYYHNPSGANSIPNLLANFCDGHLRAFSNWFSRRHQHLDCETHGFYWDRDATDEDVTQYVTGIVNSAAKRHYKNDPVLFCQEATCMRWATGTRNGVALCNQHAAVIERGNHLHVDNGGNVQPIQKAVRMLLGLEQ